MPVPADPTVLSPIRSRAWRGSAPIIARGDGAGPRSFGPGIVLPSLRVDPVTDVYGGRNTLVDLGSCNLDVAARLAAALSGREGG
ncbi:hypothetical protein ACFV1A_04595 [Streptomyces seoulensis]|uniref:hypothetical protein n=1 Tax=Streptomyces seoulensis TaxID=73044 RepID=UPI0036912F56